MMCSHWFSDPVLYIFDHNVGGYPVECVTFLCPGCTLEAVNSPEISQVIIYSKMKALGESNDGQDRSGDWE